MRFVLLTSVLFIQSIGFAVANDKCISEAGLYARLFSAKENRVSVSGIQVKGIFFHSEERGILYYAALLDTLEQVNVGVRKSDCSLKLTNYVTNDI